MDQQVPPPPPQGKMSVQQMINDLAWKLNSLETRARVNEQNLINERRHMQLMDKNFLDLKKEMRDKLDLALNNSKQAKDIAEDLKAKIEKLESEMKSKYAQKSDVHEVRQLAASSNALGSEMSDEEASNILDEIMKKSESGGK